MSTKKIVVPAAILEAYIAIHSVVDDVASGADPNGPLFEDMSPLALLFAGFCTLASITTDTLCAAGASRSHICVDVDPAPLRALLDAGAKPNTRIIDGKSPLSVAVYLHLRSLIRPLLEAGADPLARDADGKSPIDIALTRDSPEILDAIDQALAGDYPDSVRALVLAADPTAASKFPNAATAHARAMADKNWSRPRAAAC